MSDLVTTMGVRIRYYRERAHLTQMDLAEKADMHHTYIGQLERGEKNATLESIAKITRALGIPLSRLLEKIDDGDGEEKETGGTNYPLKCYEIVLSMTKAQQKHLYQILLDIQKYKDS